MAERYPSRSSVPGGRRHAASARAVGMALVLSLVAGPAGILVSRAAARAPGGLQTMSAQPAAAVGANLPMPRHALPAKAPAPSVVHGTPAHMPFYVATRGPLTIYLLGTLHIGDPADYPSGQPFRKPILDALAASPTLALELSPDDIVASQQKVSQNGVCRHACLQRQLPAPLWARVRHRLRGSPAALAAVRDMRPWLAALVIESYDAQAAGLQSEYGTEEQLENIYLRRRGNRIVGLESLDEQMDAFTRLTKAQANEMLAQDLQQRPAQNAADVRALHRLWRIGDADALAAWSGVKSERLAQSRDISAQIDERILYARDIRFANRMVRRAEPGRPLFVAIGALHLGGRRGVLDLLRKQGFQVEAR